MSVAFLTFSTYCCTCLIYFAVFLHQYVLYPVRICVLLCPVCNDANILLFVVSSYQVASGLFVLLRAVGTSVNILSGNWVIHIRRNAHMLTSFPPALTGAHKGVITCANTAYETSRTLFKHSKPQFRLGVARNRIFKLIA